MGILRFLLAVSVVVAHTGPILGTSMLPGNLAVETFFMISGFYMSLVLSSKYVGAGSTWKFYSNRFLRLYPSYLLVMFGTWAWFFFCWLWLGRVPANGWIDSYTQMNQAPKTGLIFANWTLIGLDLPSLFHFLPGQGFLPFHYHEAATAPDGAIWGGNFRTVGQAWSVGVEIWFYLMAPFVVALRTGWLIVIGLCSAGLKWVMESHGLLTYFFIPAQLGFFIVGMIAQRVWQSRRDSLRTFRYTWWVLAGIALLTILFPFWKLPGQRWIYYTLVAVSLPTMFEQTRAIQWDRLIGNLSYPVYMTHMLVISVAASVLRPGAHAYFVLATTLGVSLLLLRWVEEPLDHWRQNRAS